MNLLNFRKRIKYENTIGNKFGLWNDDAVLFKVQAGLGKLKQEYYDDDEGDVVLSLMLENKALMNVHSDNYYCPTCEKLIKAGFGISNINPNIINSIKYVQQENETIKGCFDAVKPLLSLLENGYYVLAKISMIPTDGEGNFFWTSFNNDRYYKASAETFYKSMHLSCIPKFLCPTQAIKHINLDRVEYYRNQIKQGHSMTGIAYYMEGFFSALMDGHHRATAACLEHSEITCLTILKIDPVSYDNEKNPLAFNIAGQWIHFNELNNKEFTKYYKTKRWISKRKHKKIENIDFDIKVPKSDIWNKLNINSRYYPDYLTYGFRGLVDDISENKVNALFSSFGDEINFELEMIFKILIYEDKNRAYKIAKRIIKERNKNSLWVDAYKHLSTYDLIEVEDIFIEYLIEYEPDNKDPIKLIVDAYLNNR